MLLTKIALMLTFIFLTSCSVFNSGTLSIKYTQAKATFFEKNYQNKDDWTNVSFSIRRVQHPYTYGDWNMNLSISPSIHFDRTKLELNGNGEIRAEDRWRYPDVKIQRGSALGNLKLTIHTPIGAFAGAAGYGIAGYYAKAPNLDTYKTSEIRKLDIVYIGFLSKRIFFLSGPRWYYDGNWQFFWAIRFGYFWGRIKK
ncbi:MAG: hypothetical protein KAQ98_10835 [Bacteriovoracaceae bacterium]|nr:hypothetical protein [Bacteriovoracaceae bacterium]